MNMDSRDQSSNFQIIPDRQLSDQKKDGWQKRLSSLDDFDESAFSLLTLPHGEVYRRLSSKQKNFVKEQISGKDIIDLGCGSFPEEYSEIFSRLGAKSYTGVDLWYADSGPYEKKIDSFGTRICDEVLNYLLKQPDSSVDIFTSNGFLCEEMASREYSQRVLGHIYRVLKPDGKLIAVHFTGMDPLAETSGFTKVTSFKNLDMHFYKKNAL